MRRAVLPLALGGALAMGCEGPPPDPGTPPPAAPLKAPEPVESASASRELSAYYGRVQASLQASGLLRTDEGRRDAPITTRALAENFLRVALFSEYDAAASGLVPRETAQPLRRWGGPVRISVGFSEDVPPPQRAADTGAIVDYADRLARVAEHPIRVVPGDANFHVLIVDEKARRDLGPRLRDLVPNISAGAIEVVETLPRLEYCVALTIDGADDAQITDAVAVIRAEHPDLLRLSCIHEEIAQGLGLPNDSPVARPSIFNDDEEFALLTPHDELLVSILYDPMLKAGMTADEAAPIVETLAAERLGGV